MVQYFSKDHLGSSTAVTDANGDLVESTDYRPYGEERFFSSITPDPASYRYTDQEKDFSTGLYNYDARHYDPALGRFASPDSVIPNVFDPQQLNPYAYCRNNPLRYVDPSGHEPEEGGFFDGIDTDSLGSISNIGSSLSGLLSSGGGGPGDGLIAEGPSVAMTDAGTWTVGAAGGAGYFARIGGFLSEIGSGVGAVFAAATTYSISKKIADSHDGLLGGWAKRTMDGFAAANQAQIAKSEDAAAQTNVTIQTKVDEQKREEEINKYHRIESPTQTPEVAMQIEKAGQLWGRAPRNSDIPTAQAYTGPLPDGARGIEFTTTTPPNSPGTPIANWSGPRPGVTVENGYAKISPESVSESVEALLKLSL